MFFGLFEGVHDDSHGCIDPLNYHNQYQYFEHLNNQDALLHTIDSVQYIQLGNNYYQVEHNISHNNI